MCLCCLMRRVLKQLDSFQFPSSTRYLCLHTCVVGVQLCGTMGIILSGYAEKERQPFVVDTKQESSWGGSTRGDQSDGTSQQISLQAPRRGYSILGNLVPEIKHQPAQQQPSPAGNAGNAESEGGSTRHPSAALDGEWVCHLDAFNGDYNRKASVDHRKSRHSR